MIIYFDGKHRHLVCVPYTVENLHEMAKKLDIKRCWFHNANWPHYDCPKRRVTQIADEDVIPVTPKQLLTIIKKELARQRVARKFDENK